MQVKFIPSSKATLSDDARPSSTSLPPASSCFETMKRVFKVKEVSTGLLVWWIESGISNVTASCGVHTGGGQENFASCKKTHIQITCCESSQQAALAKHVLSRYFSPGKTWCVLHKNMLPGIMFNLSFLAAAEQIICRHFRPLAALLNQAKANQKVIKTVWFCKAYWDWKPITTIQAYT